MKYYSYIDESGDHGLTKINPNLQELMSKVAYNKLGTDLCKIKSQSRRIGFLSIGDTPILIFSQSSVHIWMYRASKLLSPIMVE